MNPLASILSAIRNIHRLKSRAPRSEYWWVFALLFFGVIGATMIDAALFPDGATQTALHGGLQYFFILFYVPTLCLTLSVTIRRLHDLGMSAWYLITYFMPFGLGILVMAYILSRKGSAGPNRYGSNPLYIDVFRDAEEFG